MSADKSKPFRRFSYLLIFWSLCVLFILSVFPQTQRWTDKELFWLAQATVVFFLLLFCFVFYPRVIEAPRRGGKLVALQSAVDTVKFCFVFLCVVAGLLFLLWMFAGVPSTHDIERMARQRELNDRGTVRQDFIGNLPVVRDRSPDREYPMQAIAVEAPPDEFGKKVIVEEYFTTHTYVIDTYDPKNVIVKLDDGSTFRHNEDWGEHPTSTVQFKSATSDSIYVRVWRE